MAYPGVCRAITVDVAVALGQLGYSTHAIARLLHGETPVSAMTVSKIQRGWRPKSLQDAKTPADVMASSAGIAGIEGHGTTTQS